MSQENATYDCTSCKYYGIQEEMVETIRKIEDENIRQEDSLVEIIKKQNSDSVVRSEMYQKINTISTNQALNAKTISDHMVWEEKHQKLVLKISVFAMATIVTLMGWTLVEILSISKSNSALTEKIVAEDTKVNKTINSIEKHIDKQDQFNQMIILRMVGTKED